MPDKDGFPTADEIINGKQPITHGYCPICHEKSISSDGINITCINKHTYPTSHSLTALDVANKHRALMLILPQGIAPQSITDDQKKAINLILSGMPFISIAMRETFSEDDKETATGCDYLTSMGGDKNVLRNAKQHIEGVIMRLYDKYKIF